MKINRSISIRNYSNAEHAVMPASFRHRDWGNTAYHCIDRFSYLADRHPFL